MYKGIFDNEKPPVDGEYLKNIVGLKKFSKLVAKETGWNLEKATNEIAFVRRHMHVTPKFYYKHKLWTMEEVRMCKYIVNRKREASSKERLLNRLASLTGKEASQVEADRMMINKMAEGIYVGLSEYNLFGFNNYDPNENPEGTNQQIQKVRNLKAKEKEISDRIRNLQNNPQDSFEDIEKTFEEYKNNELNVINPKNFEANYRKHTLCMPQIAQWSDEKKIALGKDMEAVKRALKYTTEEYVAFNFIELNLEDRMKYVSGKNKTEVLRKMNQPEALNMFDSKYDTYKAISPLFKRKMEIFYGTDDLPKFAEFVKKHPECVKKDNYASMGKGVSKLSVKKDTDLKALMESLAGEIDVFILEELIKPHYSIKRLNPDSVNTVRIITLVTDGEVSVEYTFMKVGRSGSFVDNGGSGGLFVSIDKETGRFNSDGFSEKMGEHYEKHPDHGYVFKGYKLRRWKQALKMAKKAALSVDNARMVGWDLTMDRWGRWVIIEGNGLSQFIGPQATVLKPVKERLLKTTGVELVDTI